jgi:hypothetical protein
MQSPRQLVIALMLFIPILSNAQSAFKKGVKLNSRVIFSEQSYLEKSFHNSRYYDVEKNAGLCTSFMLEFDKNQTIKDKLILDYGIGATLNKQYYEFTEMFSSDFNFMEMAFSDVKSLYFNLNARLHFKKQSERTISFNPFIGIQLNLLISDYEKINPAKDGFQTVMNPEFRFRKIVPEGSIGLLCWITPNTWKYQFAVGPSISNNCKYYKEDRGILFFPVSFSINLSVRKSDF